MYHPKYFSENEFKKLSCRIADINPSSLKRLDDMREKAGIPIVLTSAYRTPEEDIKKGRSGHSAHTLGCAFDIACITPRTRHILLKAAIDAGFGRIGIAKNFLHVDDSSSHTQCVTWLY